MIPAKEIDGELWIRAADHHKAIKEALAQPEQKPVAWKYFDEAYERACNSSQPQDWMDAALLAQQVRTTPLQPKTPPECIADAEKIAFAYGWWKAMEAQRLAQTKQEPVAYRYMDIDEPDLGFWFDEKPSDLSYLKCEPLYTTPPQRTWVGLTDDEREELMDTYDVASTDYARAIEAKLKEKNT